MAIERRYWDSDLILRWLKREPGWQQLRGTIKAAEDGRVQIVTSTWTLTEVIRINGRELTAADDQKIVDFFAGEHIHMRAVTARVGHRARRLAFTHYSQKDAIHMAQAIEAGCDYFDTLDGGLHRAGPPPGVSMKVGTPSHPDSATLDEHAEEQDIDLNSPQQTTTD